MFRIILFFFLVIIHTSVKAPEKINKEEKTWAETILKFQKDLRKHQRTSSFNPYKSPVLGNRDKALKINVDVSNMEYIKLVVDGTIDGNTKDHAAWGNARFIDKSGNAVFASEVPVWKEKQGFSKLIFDKNLIGSEIIIGNNPYDKGMSMHAEGYAIFKLDGKFKGFEAEIGIEQKAGDRNSSVVFKVEDYLPDLLLEQLENEFPQETKLFKNYSATSAAALFSQDAQRIVEYVARKINIDKGINNLVTTAPTQKEQLNALNRMLQAFIVMEKVDRINPQATINAYNHLSKKYGEDYISQIDAQDKNRISTIQKDLSNLVNQLKFGDITGKQEAKRLMQLARKINLSNPLLKDKSIFLIRQNIKGNARSVMANSLGYPENNWTTSASIQSADWGWDNELAVLSNVLDPDIKSIYKPAASALINDPDIHWDGERILFSSIGENKRWNLFEINTDGSGLKQLTPSGYDDVDFFDGCYLPNGKIAMVSTAPYQGVPCVGGNQPTGSMYLLDPITKDIRQLNFGQDNDWNPVVLNNGRIMYLRWEYTDAAHYFTRILMSMNPDGTGKKEYYGSSSYWPNSLFEARPIPGRSSKFSGIVSGHHGIARSGRLAVFDPRKGRQEADGVVQEIPYSDRKVEPIIKDQLVNGVWPQFLTAYSLDEDFYLAVVKPGPEELWGLYLVDVFDNMTLISESEEEVLLYPMLLEKRVQPPVIPDKIKLSDSTSTVYIANIYEGPGLKGVPKGSVEKLRLFAYHFTYNNTGGHDALGIQSGWDVKRILGTVPVESDGSAIFEIPANTPISLQPLDENGRAMQLMRSWFTGMPGEVVSCVGCHENQNTLPPVRPTIASRKLPDVIVPFYGDVRPFTFANEIQPLLDRKCVACHDGSNKLPDFSDSNESGYQSLSASYKALHPFVRRPGPESDVHVLPPMEYHSSTSELIQKLEKGHHNVSLTREEWDRLHTWIDLNVPYHGQFEAREYCEQDQKIRRQELALDFGSIPVDIDKELEIAVYLKSLQNTNPIKHDKSIKNPDAKPVSVDWSFSYDEAKTKQHALGEVNKTIPLGDGIQLKLVKVPAGEYQSDENGLIKVEKPYWIGQLEISNAQYGHFFPDHDSRYIAQFWKDHTTRGYPINQADQPVVRISWEESLAFCEKLSEETGFDFSLPSAEQWEWACRAGAATPFWFGQLDADFSEYENLADASLSDFAVIGVDPKPMKKDNARFPYYDFIPKSGFDDGELISTTIGRYKPNPWGIYDMHGNVSEWVLDDYTIESKTIIKPSEKKTIKGGSWRDRPYRSTASSTLGYYPWQKVVNVGFRVVMEE